MKKGDIVRHGTSVYVVDLEPTEWITHEGITVALRRVYEAEPSGRKRKRKQ